MEIAKEIKKKYDELIAIQEKTAEELKPLEAYLTAAGLLDAPEDKPKRTRRKKNEPAISEKS